MEPVSLIDAALRLLNDLSSLTRLNRMNWQLQEAKARFSELIERTLKEGPQTVTRHGKAVAVVIPDDEYRRLRTGGKNLKALLAAAPLRGVEITRSRDTGRKVDLECT
ncbi:MAG: type II toxin-antitoxin system Phd/YefM family antitoxin [Candidatus Binataceae bacterium]